MRLWSIQTPAAWTDLNDKGTLRASVTHAAWNNEGWGDLETSYRWMMEQMTERIGPAPASDITPIWAWSYYGPDKARPDLRRLSRHWGGRNSEMIMIEAEIDDSKVLTSDFDGFHAPLNSSYLATNEKDWDWFYALEITTEKRKKIIQDSWQRMFEPEILDEDWFGPRDQASMQACVWEIPLEAVVSYKQFKNRSAK